MKTIPLIDLRAQSRVIGNELLEDIKETIMSSQYIMGEKVRNFEKKFCEYLNVKYSISCGNGTDALVIALESLGIGPGDEVITTPYTFFSTGESIAYVGATPVFVDVCEANFNINPKLIEAKITTKTKAIMPVHLFGHACEMDEIMKIAQKYNLYVIEDACQAIGGTYKNKKLGTIGHIACFSFFPTKNLGAAGDGGMIVTNDEKIATIAKAIRAHGSGEDGKMAVQYLSNESDLIEECSIKGDDNVYNPAKYYNYLIGHNSRLDALQAGILAIKLKYLDKWNQKRQEIALKYRTNFVENSEFQLPHPPHYIGHVYHMFIINSSCKSEMISYLNEKGISTGVYYPVPLHLQQAFKFLGYQKGDFEIAEELSDRTFAIPMFVDLEDKEIDYIIECVNAFSTK